MKTMKKNLSFEFPMALEQGRYESNHDFGKRVDNLVSIFREKLNEKDEEKLTYTFSDVGPFEEVGNYALIYFNNQNEEVDKFELTLRKKIEKEQKQAMVDYYKECKKTLGCSKQTKKSKKGKTKK